MTLRAYYTTIAGPGGQKSAARVGLPDIIIIIIAIASGTARVMAVGVDVSRAP